uniref:Uncharacterized protein n=1 Tax=Myotis myotis TaxID=51298 RepID=A0A7J7R9N8_MYOMY|nr:hypothetical protein mMyoMyo1_010858 [Myotis myotis]
MNIKTWNTTAKSEFSQFNRELITGLNKRECLLVSAGGQPGDRRSFCQSPHHPLGQYFQRHLAVSADNGPPHHPLGQYFQRHLAVSADNGPPHHPLGQYFQRHLAVSADNGSTCQGGEPLAVHRTALLHNKLFGSKCQRSHPP